MNGTFSILVDSHALSLGSLAMCCLSCRAMRDELVNQRKLHVGIALLVDRLAGECVNIMGVCDCLSELEGLPRLGLLDQVRRFLYRMESWMYRHRVDERNERRRLMRFNIAQPMCKQLVTWESATAILIRASMEVPGSLLSQVALGMKWACHDWESCKMGPLSYTFELPEEAFYQCIGRSLYDVCAQKVAMNDEGDVLAHATDNLERVYIYTDRSNGGTLTCDIEQMPTNGHMSDGYCFSLDGSGEKLLVCASDYMEIWDVGDEWGPIHSCPMDAEEYMTDDGERVTSVNLSSDGNMALCAYSTGHIHVWDVSESVIAGIDDWRTCRTIIKPNEETINIWDTAMSWEGGVIATGNEQGTCCVFYLEYGTYDAKCIVRGAVGGQRQSVQSVSLNWEGTVLAAGGNGGDLWVYTVSRTGHELTHRLKGHTGEIICTGMDENGTIVASGSEDGTVQVWDLEGAPEGKLRHRLQGESGYVWSLAMSKDGTKLTSIQERIHLWDIS